jgi:hypothetical protein
MSPVLVAPYRFAAPGSGYSGTVLADSPLGYWRLGEGPATAADSSGNGRSLTYSGSASYGQPSLIPSDTSDLSYSMSIVTGGAQASDAAWMHPSAFTIEAVVKWAGTNTSNTQCIASKTVGGTVNATNYQFMLYKPSGGSNVSVIVGSSGGAGTLNDTSSFLGSGSTVRHIAATFDGSTVKLYGDGSLLQSTSLSGTLAPCTSAAFWIGDTAGGSRKWAGGLDEVAYYGTALSSTRIAAHFAASGL